MAIRCLFLALKKDLGKLLSFFPKSNTRTLVHLYSTAAHQRSTGDDCHGDEHMEEEESQSAIEMRMLRARANKLEQQVKDITERYQKALADSEMVRRRTRKYVEDAKLFGIQSFCRDLVEVADVMERAVSTFESKDAAAEGRDAAVEDRGAAVEGDAQLFSDMVQALDRLQGIFAKHGLEKMKPVGGYYDPYQHEIISHVPAEGVRPGNVAIVRQDGYRLHGRTIRHAHVCLAMETQEQ